MPALLVLIMDVVRRSDRLRALGPGDRARYLLAVLESAALWAPLVLLSARRRGALRWLASAALVLLAALVVGVQRYFYDQYATYLNGDSALFGWTFRASVVAQIRADLRGIVHAELAPIIFAVALVFAARRILDPRDRVARWAAFCALLALSAALAAPWSFRAVQAATPDVIGVSALGGFLRTRMSSRTAQVAMPGLRHPQYVPALTPAEGAPARNVLLILTESVRFDSVCVAHDPACRVTPFTNEAAPSRLPLLQLRANDSTTAISVGVLFSGLMPTESREAIHSAPLVFDFARAAGYDAAYYTSQHPLFANARLFVQDLPVSSRALATDLDPGADLDNGAADELATERAARELALLREPWLAVVQYANTHFPYRFDDEDAPFQPATTSKAPQDNAALMNLYKNAVYMQDKTIAGLVRAVRAMPAGARTVILFTSDHGEAFREHGQLGHTVSIYDEELHVPGWIDAPEGTLDDAERDGLKKAAHELVFHADLAATMLDLLRVWDAPELSRFRARMAGVSLLRAKDILARASSAAPMALTNCTDLWGCAFRNWGLMRGSRKLEAREWDADWHCWDVRADPAEQRDLGRATCGDLADSALRLFGSTPRESAPMPERD